MWWQRKAWSTRQRLLFWARKHCSGGFDLGGTISRSDLATHLDFVGGETDSFSWLDYGTSFNKLAALANDLGIDPREIERFADGLAVGYYLPANWRVPFTGPLGFVRLEDKRAATADDVTDLIATMDPAVISISGDTVTVAPIRWVGAEHTEYAARFLEPYLGAQPVRPPARGRTTYGRLVSTLTALPDQAAGGGPAGELLTFTFSGPQDGIAITAYGTEKSAFNCAAHADPFGGTPSAASCELRLFDGQTELIDIVVTTVKVWAPGGNTVRCLGFTGQGLKSSRTISETWQGCRWFPSASGWAGDE